MRVANRMFKSQKIHVRLALLAVLLSVVLYMVANLWMDFYVTLGLSVQWLYVAAHLLAAYGMAVLLWPIVVRQVGSRCHHEHSVALHTGPDRWEIGGIVAITAYHLVAAVAYALSFAGLLYEITLGFCMLKTFLCCFIIFDFLTEDKLSLRFAGVMLLIVCACGCPYHLPETWAFVQWLIAKTATVALAIELYTIIMSMEPQKVKK